MGRELDDPVEPLRRQYRLFVCKAPTTLERFKSVYRGSLSWQSLSRRSRTGSAGRTVVALTCVASATDYHQRRSAPASPESGVDCQRRLEL